MRQSVNVERGLSWAEMMSGTRTDRSPPQALRQKRRHTKSKKGCVTCKMRRVKVGYVPRSLPLFLPSAREEHIRAALTLLSFFQCDETSPRCRICSTRNLRCEYAVLPVLEDASSLSSTASPSPHPTSSRVPSITNKPCQTSTTPDALLWQYYLAHASKTITASSTDPAHTRMWAESIPAIAFSSAVVSHALMAFSAFCLCASPTSPPRKFELRATAERHYYHSVKLLRRSLEAAGQREADVVLACAMVLIPCGLALVGSDDRGVFSLRDWACHLRGWRVIGASIYGEVDAASKLIPYPQPGIPDVEDLPERLIGDESTWTSSMPLMKEIRRSWPEAMARLRRAVDSYCKFNGGSGDAAHATIYTSAITALEHVVDYILAYPVINLFRAVFIWPVWVSPEFIELLAHNNGLALAIYAHWLVLTMTLEDLWWLEGFGSGQVERLAASQVIVGRGDFDGLWAWPVEMLDARQRLG
jgi:hypothetical protein